MILANACVKESIPEKGLNKVDSEEQVDSKAVIARELSKLSSDDPIFTVFEQLISEMRETGYYENEFFLNVDKLKPQSLLNGLSIEAYLLSQGDKEVIARNTSQHQELEQVLLNLCDNEAGLSVLIYYPDNGSANYNNKIYFDDHFDDQDPNSSISYYQNGHIGTQNHLNKPNKVTFIVRISEAYVSPEYEASEIFQKYMDATTLSTLNSSCGNSLRFFSGGGFFGGPNQDDDPDDPVGCTERCERDCQERTENIHCFRARHDYEGWTRGSGEFEVLSLWAENVQYMTVNGDLTVTGASLSFVIHTATGVDDDNAWIYPNFEIFFWDPSVDGNRVKHVWYESDTNNDGTASGNISLTITGTPATAMGGGGFSITISNPFGSGDDLIGESIVEYCQDINPNGFEYHPSTEVDFLMNER